MKFMRAAGHEIHVMRIVARLNIGGPARHIASLASALDPKRIRSSLIVGQLGQGEGDMSYLFEEEGLRAPIVIPELERSVVPLRDLVALIKLVRVLRRERPHIVETHTAKAGFVGRVAARLAGVPIVVHVFHGHVFYGYFGRLQTRAFVSIERLLGRLSDRIVTISASQKRDIAQRYRIASSSKVALIPLGFDLAPFAAACRADGRRFRAAAGLPADGPLVGFVGRLTAVKNPELFVEAARQVLETQADTHFVLVGDGELRKTTEARVLALGLAEHIHLVGWQRDMPAVYAALDVLVLSSLNEGTPVTAIESLAAGVPVVGTAVGGMADVVRDGDSGLLVPSGDASALAAAIETLLCDSEQGRRLAQAGQKDVLRRFSQERLVADMEELYSALMAGSGLIP